MWLRNHPEYHSVVRGLLTTWRVVSTFVTLCFIVLGLSLAFVYRLSDTDGAVYEVVDGSLKVDNAARTVNGRPIYQIPREGFLNYSVKSRQLEACPSTQLISYRRQRPDGSIQNVITNRPLQIRSEIGKYSRADLSVQIPPELEPGIYEVAVTHDATCPLRKRSDLIVKPGDLAIEVVP